MMGDKGHTNDIQKHVFPECTVLGCQAAANIVQDEYCTGRHFARQKEGHHGKGIRVASYVHVLTKPLMVRVSSLPRAIYQSIRYMRSRKRWRPKYSSSSTCAAELPSRTIDSGGPIEATSW